MEVGEFSQVRAASLSMADARRSGFDDMIALRKAASKTELVAGDMLFRISFHYVGADSRPGPPRDVPDLETLAELGSKLDAMDHRSKRGAWTRATLRVIEERPRIASSKLASQFGLETQQVKQGVRKLKRLGLTISHEVSHELSPRGAAVLEAAERATAQ